MLFNMLFMLVSWLAVEILNFNGNIPDKIIVTLKKMKILSRVTRVCILL